jgi:PAS domain-containing protein
MMKLTHGPSLGAGAPSLLADADRLGRAAEAGSAGIWEWHLAQDVAHLNLKQAAILGLEPPALQIASGRFFDLVHQDDLALLRVEIAETQRSDGKFSHEFRIHREDSGELRWLCSQGTVVERDEAGEAKVVAGLAFDFRRHSRGPSSIGVQASYNCEATI